MRCNLLYGCLVSGLLLGVTSLSSQVTSDREDWGEVEWVEHIAVTEYGLSVVDGKVSGVEVRLFNGKRVDMIWQSWAIEVDWAAKASEGIGQCLYYAAATGKKPALLLLVKKPSRDIKYIEQALVVCRSNEPEIRLWAYNVTEEKFMRLSDEP